MVVIFIGAEVFSFSASSLEIIAWKQYLEATVLGIPEEPEYKHAYWGNQCPKHIRVGTGSERKSGSA